MRSLAFLPSAASSVSWTPSFTLPVSRATLRACARSILGLREHRFELVRRRDRRWLRGRGGGRPLRERARERPVDEVDRTRAEGDRLADDDVLGDPLELVDLPDDRGA